MNLRLITIQASAGEFRVFLRPGEDGWIIVECPAIAGCISQGKTREEALANIREAIEMCLEAEGLNPQGVKRWKDIKDKGRTTEHLARLEDEIQAELAEIMGREATDIKDLSPEARAALEAGLESAKTGPLVYLGSFAEERDVEGVAGVEGNGQGPAMKCPDCHAEMTSRVENYQYEYTGLLDVTLLDVEVRHCSKCGDSRVVIPNLDGLHRAIALQFEAEEVRVEYVAEISREGDYWLAEFPDCPGCQTFATSKEALEVKAKDALEGWLAAHLEHGRVPPEPVSRLPGKDAIGISVARAPYYRFNKQTQCWTVV